MFSCYDPKMLSIVDEIATPTVAPMLAIIRMFFKVKFIISTSSFLS